MAVRAVRIILTLGTFDLFHVGHVELLERCWGIADGGPVIVAVNTDEFVERYKGKRPIVPFADRVTVVSACRFVGSVHGNDGEHQPWLVDLIHPDIIAVGDDWQDRDYLAQLDVTQGWLDERGIRIVYVPRTTGVSSSQVRASLR